MFCVFTEIMAKDDTVTFESNHASCSAFIKPMSEVDQS